MCCRLDVRAGGDPVKADKVVDNIFYLFLGNIAFTWKNKVANRVAAENMDSL